MNMMLPRTAAEEALGVSLPTRRDEEWKWTDLRRMVSSAYGKASAVVDGTLIDRLVATSPFSAVKARRIVFVNGRVDESRSESDGLSLEDGAPNVVLDDPLVDLNTRLAARTYTIVFEGSVDSPVEIVFVSAGEGTAVASRLHVEVAAGASATLIETHVGEGNTINCPLTTITLRRTARLDRIKVERDAPSSKHLAQTIISLDEGAQLNDFTLTSGAELSRQNVNVTFLGQNATSTISGAYLLKGKQHADTRLVVDHAVPHCTSRELFKCVMDGNARGIFQGKVIVRRDAQKTDGKQSTHALLLSETAEFDAKPELEIYADDVVCGHGATSGDLNHDHLFYIMSRGIPESEAKSLLIAAFVGEAIETVEHEALREALKNLAAERLAG